MFSKIFLIFVFTSSIICGPEEEQGVKYASRCEACKFLAIELQDKLTETGKSHDVIQTGYSVDDVKPKKVTPYRRSELRLIESLDNVCERILKYNLHKERTDSTRFAKGMSQTFQTLHGLVDKGVKVDLGIPYDLWDTPPVEVTNMKNQCESLLEQHEASIENWYFKHQDEKPLIEYLCADRALQSDDKQCLTEELETNTKGDVGKTEDDKDEL